MKFYCAIWLTLILPFATSLFLDTEPSVREIMTSQDLVYTKLGPVKSKSKTAKRNFKAELRDVYKVIKHTVDSSYVELNWTVCPAGNCPTVGQYEEGTPYYKKIDTFISLAKRRKATL
jgi:hypothetical protein